MEYTRIKKEYKACKRIFDQNKQDKVKNKQYQLLGEEERRMKQGTIQIGQFSYFPNQVAGQGATGMVYTGYRNSDKMPVAVKTINLSEINTAVKKHLLDCEVSALKTIRHKHVCQVFDVLKDQEYYFIPMEFCPNGTLRHYIKSQRKLSEGEALSMFYKILQGYCGIRAAGFIHRDLKTQNILLRSNMQPAIIDFGYCQNATTQNQRLSYNVGSPAYMSPQAYNDSFYSQKSDVWALGIILHQMLTGTIPVMRTTDVNKYFEYLKTMKTAQIIPGYQNPLCTKILLSALTVDQNSRPSADQLLSIMQGQEIQSPLRRRTNSAKGELSLNMIRNSLQNQPYPRKMSQVENEEQISPMLRRPQSQAQIPFQLSSPIRRSNNSNMAEDSSPRRTPGLRNTMAPQGFSTLRKKVTQNSFQLDVNPVQTRFQKPQENEISPYRHPMNQNKPQYQIYSPAQFTSKQIPSPVRMRRNYSTNQINLPPRFI